MDQRQSRLHASDVLGGRYRILSVLGQGGMGTVYLAEDLKLHGKQWAIKETDVANHDFQKFMDEAEILTKLSHPYLPNVVDYLAVEEEGVSYLVMDYIKGQTLQEVFAAQNRSMPYRKIVRYAVQICELFQYLHHEQEKPIIYRDLKPSNLMIDEKDQIRLIDFGIARNFKEGKQTDTVQLGTIGFAAPEQFEGRQTDHRTDLYALGAVMYYLLSDGQYYYVTRKRLDEVVEGLPPELVRTVEKLLRKSPIERYQQAAQVRDDLLKLLEAERRELDHRFTAEGSLHVRERERKRMTIAVTSVHQGAGSTHLALMIAGGLARSGWSVAIIEANDSQDFSRIECAYDGFTEPISSTPQFTIQGVHYYKSDPNLDMISLFSHDYDFIVLDIGFYEDNRWFPEFLRADKQIVVASGSEWRQPYIDSFYKSQPALDRSRLVWIIPFASDQMIRDIRRKLNGHHVIALPAHPDPFMISSEIIPTIEQVVGMSGESNLRNKRNQLRTIYLISASAILIFGLILIWNFT